MVGQTFSYGNNTVMHHRKILKETIIGNVRHYILRNLDNPESKQIPAVADAVDKIFAAQKGDIRKNKYSDRAFQRARPKAGGF